MNGVSNSKGAVGIYDGIMLKFYAIPAKTDSGTGRVRFKIEKPVDSTGVMIRYKTSEWLDSHTCNSGYLVANIADDTAYKGVNQWYEATGLPLNQDLYFCAFPYKGSAYSSVKSENLTKCRAGGLLTEYTMDSVSGSTYNDTSGNNNHGTGTNLSSTTGLIGNSVKVGTGSVAQIDIPSSGWAAPTSDHSRTAVVWVKFSALGYKHVFIDIGSDYKYLSLITDSTLGFYYGSNIPGNVAIASLSSDIDSWVCLICKWDFENTKVILKVRRDRETAWRVAEKTTNLVVGNPLSCHALCSPVATHTDPNYFVDTFRQYNRVTADYEDDNFYNGGAGC